MIDAHNTHRERTGCRARTRTANPSHPCLSTRKNFGRSRRATPAPGENTPTTPSSAKPRGGTRGFGIHGVTLKIYSNQNTPPPINLLTRAQLPTSRKPAHPNDHLPSGDENRMVNAERYLMREPTCTDHGLCLRPPRALSRPLAATSPRARGPARQSHPPQDTASKNSGRGVRRAALRGAFKRDGDAAPL